eukprot:CAMPEP_0180702846 /NCGR_PEP_ID=MMETSP1038_2-20121128/6327_1 /TAXON_ID=632150 /ORGANISM="Azadinium spinosum, Strain 3D9" /LENGTH=581 /DNA_ID=CAMNT_0022734613 /DNA_START=15 /DNA_END=1760 /DNA_ORIENTATION=+
MGMQGSVFPKAVMYALPSALLAFGLKFAQQEEYITLQGTEILSQNNVYSGFTFVLGFSLVFRTSQAYSRYWTAATSVHEMGSEWVDACASLLSFAQISKKPPQEIERFTHTVVRLFCLLHAMALEEIATLRDENFPLIDIEGFHKGDLKELMARRSQGKKMQIVLTWIKVFIVKSMDQGLLTVPPPILSRVFQELGSGLVRCYNAQQVVIWPFPYPYTQLNLILIWIYMVATPFVICAWDTESWLCGLFTLVSVVCMLGLDLIASELENPFGDDSNDLPCLEMQHDMNRSLIIFLNPLTWRVPELSPAANFNYADIAARDDSEWLSLQQYHDRHRSMRHESTGLSGHGGCGCGWRRPKLNKLMVQLSWARQQWPDFQMERLGKLLGIVEYEEEKVSAISSQAHTSSTLQSQELSTQGQSGLTPQPTAVSPAHVSFQAVDKSYSYLGSSNATGSVSKLEDKERTSGIPGGPPWTAFLEDLDRHLRHHLEQQLQQQGDVFAQQMTVFQELFGQIARKAAGQDIPGDDCSTEVPLRSPGAGKTAAARRGGSPRSARPSTPFCCKEAEPADSRQVIWPKPASPGG